MQNLSVVIPSLGAILEADEHGLIATALKSALELDVFEIIASGGQRADHIAAAAQASPRGMSVLLDALCAKELLSKSGSLYQLTPTSETYLIRRGPGYCAPMYLAWLQARGHFTDFVRTGRATLDLTAPEAEELWVSYARPDRVRLPELIDQVTQRWTSAGLIPLPWPGASILDVGSGSGFKSFALLQADPTARVTAVDSPGVLEIARDVAERLHVSDRVTFQSGDVLTEVPAASFDLVLFGSLLHYFDPAAVIVILQKAQRALKAGGLAIIYTRIVDDERQSDPGLLSMVDVSNCAPHGQHYTYAEYRSLLEAAGFVNVTLRAPVLISAEKR